jgi:hypothetical protein
MSEVSFNLTLLDCLTVNFDLSGSRRPTKLKTLKKWTEHFKLVFELKLIKLKQMYQLFFNLIT